MGKRRLIRACAFGVLCSVLTSDNFGNTIMPLNDPIPSQKNDSIYYGNITLSEDQIKRSVNVFGNLVIRKSRLCSDLTVYGQVDAVDSEIQGRIKIIGFLRAQRTNFSGDLEVTADKVIFESTKAKNITIHDSSSPSGETMILSGTSKISGCITFTSGKGLIQKKRDTDLPACVVGARIEQN